MENVPVYYVEAEALYSSTIGQGIKTLCITSSERREGVSTIAYSTARRSAAGGRKTLLIDLNLYNPSVGSRLGVPQVEWNLTDRSYESAIVDFADIGLSILPAPSLSFASTDLREKEIIKEHLGYLAAEYEVIIIDCAAVNAEDFRGISGPLIAGICDATIIVALGGHTNQDSLDLCINKLRKNDARIIGSVLNDYNNMGMAAEISEKLDRVAMRFPFMANFCDKFGNKLRQMHKNT